MNMIEIIGYMGMAIILYSFMVTEMYKLRLINSIGCLLWITYGIGIMAWPTILVNICVLVIHSYWFYKNSKGAGAGGESIKENFIDSVTKTNKMQETYQDFEEDYPILLPMVDKKDNKIKPSIPPINVINTSEWLYKKIWELKSKSLTSENKKKIQKIQQSLYESKSKPSITPKNAKEMMITKPDDFYGKIDFDDESEKWDKNNSAKNSSIENEDIEAFLFNRYNR